MFLALFSNNPSTKVVSVAHRGICDWRCSFPIWYFQECRHIVDMLSRALLRRKGSPRVHSKQPGALNPIWFDTAYCQESGKEMQLVVYFIYKKTNRSCTFVMNVWKLRDPFLWQCSIHGLQIFLRHKCEVIFVSYQPICVVVQVITQNREPKFFKMNPRR
jgi:hypothetical protein